MKIDMWSLGKLTFFFGTMHKITFNILFKHRTQTSLSDLQIAISVLTYAFRFSKFHTVMATYKLTGTILFIEKF